MKSGWKGLGLGVISHSGVAMRYNETLKAFMILGKIHTSTW